jgi:ABC-type nitrate/sulfonate/bicarbonate transport system substrate-binding protein
MPLNVPQTYPQKADPMHTSPLPTIRIIAFPGAPNLPIFAAIAQGFFAEEGVKVDLSLTPSSVMQAQKTADGDCEMVFTAFDNVVAYGEGQGAAGPDVNPDYVVVMGATQLELSLIVAPDVVTFADLKGRTIALDALATGFAFVLDEMIAQGGLAKADTQYVAVGATPQRWHSVQDGTHAATLTIEPFTSLATRAGFKVLDTSSRLFESYQGGVCATRRSFLRDHPDQVRALVKGYLRGLAWVTDPANRDAAEALLQERMPEIKPQAVGSVMKSLMSPRSGLTPNGEILPKGMAQVLDLRTRHGACDAPLTDISRYLDLGIYENVLKDLQGGRVG